MSKTRQYIAVDADGTLQVIKAAGGADPDGSILNLVGMPSTGAILSSSSDASLLASSDGMLTAI